MQLLTVIGDMQVQKKQPELTSAKPPLPITVSGNGKLQSKDVQQLMKVHACTDM